LRLLFSLSLLYSFLLTRAKEREQFFVERGMGINIWEMQKIEGEDNRDILMEKDREEQKRIRWERIKESRYNKWYGKLKWKGSQNIY